MYDIVFYRNRNDCSELEEYLLYLANKSINNKDARIQLNQIVYCIELLKRNGTVLPSTILKHLKENIWELRPGNNRVLFFYLKNNQFVLLHIFRKQTQKTPSSEIEKAKKERDDFIERNGGMRL